MRDAENTISSTTTNMMISPVPIAMTVAPSPTPVPGAT
jgi:hypothetical protein